MRLAALRFAAAAGSGTGSGSSVNNGFSSHGFDDDQSQGVSSDNADPDDDANGMESGISRPVDTNQRIIPSDVKHLDPPV